MQELNELVLSANFPKVLELIKGYLPEYKAARNKIQIEKLLDREIGYSMSLLPHITKNKYFPKFSAPTRNWGDATNYFEIADDCYSLSTAESLKVNMALKHLETRLTEMAFQNQDIIKILQYRNLNPKFNGLNCNINN